MVSPNHAANFFAVALHLSIVFRNCSTSWSVLLIAAQIDLSKFVFPILWDIQMCVRMIFLQSDAMQFPTVPVSLILLWTLVPNIPLCPLFQLYTNLERLDDSFHKFNWVDHPIHCVMRPRNVSARNGWFSSFWNILFYLMQ